MDMTRGEPRKLLILFAIPMILGGIFQLLYNTVDTIVVGRFVSEDALAAIGATSTSTLLINVLGNSFTNAITIITSQAEGASLPKRIRQALTHSVYMVTAVGLILGLISFFGARPFMRFLGCDPTIIDLSVLYLRIVCGLTIFSLWYQGSSALLRGIGDSKTPLYFLIFSSVLNVVLDLVFVLLLKQGVAGVGWATVISQACAAALCGWLLHRNEPVFFAESSASGGRARFGVDRGLLKRTLRFSYASALQQAGIYVGKLLVQSMVNPLGVQAAAAFTAVNRIDDYALIPERDIASGETVLVAQNHGARKFDRMQQGLRAAMVIEAAYGLIVSLAVFALAGPLMRLFVPSTETEVIRLGTRYLRLMGFFYFMPGITNGLQGYMRAMGKMNITMYVTYSQMFIRAICTWLLIGRMQLDAVPLACVAGWILMLVWETGLIVHWKRTGKLYR